MKKVITNPKLQEKMKEAINLLCNTVKTTLGPKGSNTIIDHSAFTPFITNDGVTIAQNIESEDEIINTILQIAKESSIKTNSEVGDGTTTTLVLLQSIFTSGIDLISEGINPIIIKKELTKSLSKIIPKLTKKSHTPTSEELKNIAYTSSNSKEIADILIKAYQTNPSCQAITLKENINYTTEIIEKQGYIIETLIASSYFFKDKKEINITSPKILLVNAILNDIEEIAPYLNSITKTNASLVIVCEDYSDIFLNQILSLYLTASLSIYLLKTPEYGNKKLTILEDLALISNTSILTTFSKTYNISLGEVSNITITPNETTFKFVSNSNINKKISTLKKVSSTDEDYDFTIKRLAMFTNGLIEILIGAPTTTERREKKMRYEDALCALNSANSGVLPGSGLTLYEISEELLENSIGNKIFKKALKEPLIQILLNAGLDENEIISKLKKSSYQEIYNVKTNKFEPIIKTTIIDSLNVVITSLVNATSIASMLLTTSSLIINEHQNNFEKISSYNEL